MRSTLLLIALSIAFGVIITLAVAWIGGNTGSSYGVPFRAASTSTPPGNRSITVRPCKPLKFFFSIEPGIKDYQARSEQSQKEMAKVVAEGGRVISAGPRWQQVAWNAMPWVVRAESSQLQQNSEAEGELDQQSEAPQVAIVERRGLAQGWPFACMFAMSDNNDFFDNESYDAMVFFGEGLMVKTIPYRIHWPGFLASTLFYGIPILCISAGLRWKCRSWSRRRLASQSHKRSAAKPSTTEEIPAA